jgi:hypothetical protein
MVKRGLQPVGYESELRTTLPKEVGDVLDLMVRLGGVSKATIVRIALIEHLSTLGLLFPEVADTLHSTTTHGRLSSDRLTQKEDR